MDNPINVIDIAAQDGYKRTIPSLAAALDEFELFVRKYMVIGEPEIVTVILWAAHTWVVDALWVTGYLHVTSGEYECGKTRLTNDVCGSVVWQPQHVGDTSPADLYRTLDDGHPTILIDEVDAQFDDKRMTDKAEAIRKILNLGYRRRGAEVRRWNVTTRSSEVFNVFGCKALTGTGDLPRSLATRSHRIRLKKRLATEAVAEWIDFEEQSVNEAAPIREAFKSFAPVIKNQLKLGRPPMPPGVYDRNAEKWAGLLAVADAAGGPWPERARAAAVALVANAADDDPSEGIRLLSDLRDVIEAMGRPQRILTSELLQRLTALDDAPWANHFGKTPLHGAGLAKLLRRYDVKPRTVRAAQGRGKGYFLEHLEEAFARYLPPNSRDTRDNPDGYAENTGRGTRDTGVEVTGVSKSANPHGYADVTGVTGKSGVEACDEWDRDPVAGENGHSPIILDRLSERLAALRAYGEASGFDEFGGEAAFDDFAAGCLRDAEKDRAQATLAMVDAILTESERGVKS